MLPLRFTYVLVWLFLYFPAQKALCMEKTPLLMEGQKSAEALGEDPGPLYTQVVRQWTQATDFARNAAIIAVGKLQFDMRKDPKLQSLISPAFTADLEQYFYELFLSSEMMRDLARLYSQYFSLDELQELVKFYQTPLGQKMVKSNAELILKSQQIGVNLLKRHEKEYMRVIAKYILQKEQKPSPAKTGSLK